MKTSAWNAGAILLERLDEVGGLYEHFWPFQLVNLEIRLAPLARGRQLSIDLASHPFVSFVWAHSLGRARCHRFMSGPASCVRK